MTNIIKINYDTNHMKSGNRKTLTLGDGTTENVFIIRSGYSSRIFDMSNVPIPEPVPPPSEWANWNP